MERVVNDFVAVLRRHGLRVSPAESLDALAGLTNVDLGLRPEVRDTLRATLVKDSDELATFEHLFDVFFTLGPAGPGQAGEHHDHDHGHQPDAQPPSSLELDDEAETQSGRSDDHGEATEDLRNFFERRRLRASDPSSHGESDRLRLSLFSQQLMLNRSDEALDRVLRRVTQQLRVRSARNIINPGSLSVSAASEELPVEVTAGELAELVDQLRELDVDAELLAELEAQADAIRDQLPALIEAMRARQAALGADQPDAQLADVNLMRVSTYSEADRRQLEIAIRRLAKRLHGSHSRRRHRHHRGQIDVPRTVRRNLRYEGVPFEPVLRQRREQRPRLVVLCDVSLSTRNLARFWLQLVYQLQDLFANVRTFAFVADVVEVTELFRDKTFDGAVSQLFNGRLLDVDANSDFGRALGQFRDRCSEAVTGRTSVVILGDGRNNGRDPGLPALEEVARRARRVVWMTPEQRHTWSLGTCDMLQYESVVDRVEVVRTIDQLAGVAEELVLAGAAGRG